jgi:hypothetical protein
MQMYTNMVEARNCTLQLYEGKLLRSRLYRYQFETPSSRYAYKC